MVVFLFIFFVLLIVYSILISFYQRSWDAIPEVVSMGNEVMMITVIPEHSFSTQPAEEPEQGRIKVSLIIPVRNEAQRISLLLENLSLLNYPGLEIIIADDHSTDNSWQLLQGKILPGKILKCVQLQERSEGKKKAIEAGIQVAGGELIVTTDADCSFLPHWIHTIADYYSATGAKFIAAPVNMTSADTLTGIFQRLDFLILQGITGASVNKKFHMMCNGANLAYPREVFMEVSGFEGIDNIPSGDDMLLMHKVYEKYPDKVFYLKSKTAVVTTPAEKSWKDFFQQRIRWASKAVHYKDKRIIYVLAITYFVNVGFLVLAAAAVSDKKWFVFLFLMLLAKIIVEYPFVRSVAVFFGQQKLVKYFILLQPLHMLYTVIAGWLGRFGSYKWKSRTIKNNSGRNTAKM